MDDIESLCRRVLLINHGRLLLDGTLADLRGATGNERRLIVDLEQPVPMQLPDGVRLLESSGTRSVLAFDAGQLPAHVLVARLSERYPVHDLLVEHPPIEEVVAAHYASIRPTE